MKACRKKLLSQVKVKKINDVAVTGSSMTDLCKKCIDMVNKGGVPNMQNAWDYVCTQQNSRALDLALEEIDSHLLEYKESLIGDDHEFKSIKHRVQRASINVFKNKSIFDTTNNNLHNQNNPFFQQINQKLKNCLSDMKTNKKQELDEFLETLSKDKLQSIYDRLYAYEYQTRESFEQDVQEFTDSMSHSLLDVFGGVT